MASESGGVRLSSEDLEEIEGEFGNFGIMDFGIKKITETNEF
jgi:hypothetical protein